MEEPLDLSHVAARPVARLPTGERLRYARADRWIGYTRATDALNQLETLFAWPSTQRMPNLLLIGPTNNGKSMIIEKFRRSYLPVSHPDREEIPVLVVQMPSDSSVTRFYTRCWPRPARRCGRGSTGLPTSNSSCCGCCGRPGCGCW